MLLPTYQGKCTPSLTQEDDQGHVLNNLLRKSPAPILKELCAESAPAHPE